MKIKEIWFDADYIYGRDEEGCEHKQSMLWYPRLRQAIYTHFTRAGVHFNKTSNYRWNRRMIFLERYGFGRRPVGPVGC